MSSLNLTAIASEVGDYISQNKNQIWATIRQGVQYRNYAQGIPKVTGKWTSFKSSVTELNQPWQSGFQEKGTVAITPYVNEAMKVKVDTLLQDIDGLMNGYLDFMTTEGKARSEWPFPKWIVSYEFIPKMIEEIEQMMCIGVYVAPTPGTAGGYLDSYDGIFTQVTSLVTASKLTPITVGATTVSNAIDKMYTFMDGIPEHLKNLGGTIFTSVAEQKLYMRNYRNLYVNSGNQGDKTKVTLDEYPNIEIVGLVGAVGVKRKMFVAGNSKDSLVHLYNELNGPSNFEVQPFNRDLKFLHDRHEGVGFHHLGAIRVSDVA